MQRYTVIARTLARSLIAGLCLASSGAPSSAQTSMTLPVAAIYHSLDGNNGLTLISPSTNRDRSFFVRPSTGEIRGIKPVSPGTYAFGPSLGRVEPRSGVLTFTPPDGSGSVTFTPVDGPAWTAEAFLIRSEPVSFTNQGAKLAGVLFTPPGDGPFPAVVLAHGSGKETRDGALGPAMMFVEQGIAALVFDKRGCGESQAADWRASFADYADDMLAGARSLRARKDVKPDAIGVWGHSQGAWVAPLAAARSGGAIAFVIAECGGVVDPITQEEFRGRESMRIKLAKSFTPEQIDQAVAYRRIKYEYASTGEGKDRYDTATEESRSKPWFKNVTERLPDEAFWRPNGTYDPTPTLARLECPTLLIFAEFDTMTPTPQSVERLRSKPLADKKQLEHVVIPGSNHALFESGGGKLLEDEEADATKLAPGYLSTVKEWLSVHVPGVRVR